MSGERIETPQEKIYTEAGHAYYPENYPTEEDKDRKLESIKTWEIYQDDLRIGELRKEELRREN